MVRRSRRMELGSRLKPSVYRPRLVFSRIAMVSTGTRIDLLSLGSSYKPTLPTIAPIRPITLYQTALLAAPDASYQSSIPRRSTKPRSTITIRTELPIPAAYLAPSSIPLQPPSSPYPPLPLPPCSLLLSQVVPPLLISTPDLTTSTRRAHFEGREMGESQVPLLQLLQCRAVERLSNSRPSLPSLFRDHRTEVP